MADDDKGAHPVDFEAAAMRHAQEIVQNESAIPASINVRLRSLPIAGGADIKMRGNQQGIAQLEKGK